jgi:DNA-binding NarL/FixJ family response regulator
VPVATPVESDLSHGRVLLGHAQPRLSEGLRGMLEASFGQTFMVADRASLLDGAARLRPELVVVDIALAEGNLTALISDLRQHAPGTRTLLLSDYDDPWIDAVALAAGADGVVSKASLAADLYSAIDTVLAGGRFTSTGEPH